MAEPEKKDVTIQIPFSFVDIRAFSQLVRELRFENRFFLSEVPAKFLEGLVDYAKRFKIHEIAAGTRFYRARIHKFRMEEEFYPSQKMGPPPRHKATHGRLNPVGIPYLYLASDISTAVSEVRPWIGCELTVVEFILTKHASVVNFSNRVFVNAPSDDSYAAAEITWRELITFMFSMPFDPRDDTAYIPTQYVAERIKKEGFAGIIYDSALNKDGYNLTLFDPNIAQTGNLFKVEVKSISYENVIGKIPTTNETADS